MRKQETFFIATAIPSSVENARGKSHLEITNIHGYGESISILLVTI
jgi:hypothetical protein